MAGGDGGSAIAQSMAIQFPASVIGIHLTDIGWHDHGAIRSRDIEQQYLAAVEKKFMEDGAYAAVQMSQPRALAASLNDSPAGLASWIVDRFHSWCDSPRHLEQSFSKDEMLTNITIYWVTQTIQSSIYGYLRRRGSRRSEGGDHVDCPVGARAVSARHGGIPPRRLAERTLNVVRWTEMPGGGHFGALGTSRGVRRATSRGSSLSLADPLPSGPSMDIARARPFEIRVDDSVLADLDVRLAATRLPPEQGPRRLGCGRQSGLSSRPARILARSTTTGAREEAKLNRFGQFRAEVRGADIHFIHERGRGRRRRCR